LTHQFLSFNMFLKKGKKPILPETIAASKADGAKPLRRIAKSEKTAKDAKSAKERSEKQLLSLPNSFLSWRSWRTWRFKNRLCNRPDQTTEKYD